MNVVKWITSQIVSIFFDDPKFSFLFLTYIIICKRLLFLDVPVCVRDNDREETSFTSWNWNIFTIGSFFFLQFAIGVGNIAFMALGITYIDDNSETEKSPQFIGLYYIYLKIVLTERESKDFILREIMKRAIHNFFTEIEFMVSSCTYKAAPEQTYF